MSIGPLEVVIIVLIVLLVAGGRWIPQLGRALGTGLRELREHVGGRSAGERIDRGREPPDTPSAEATEDEETAKRP